MSIESMFNSLKMFGFVQDAYKDGHISHRKNGDYVKKGNEWFPIPKEKEKEKEKENESETSLQFEKPKDKMSCRRFKNNLIVAKSTCSEDKAWRVDTGHDELDYLHDKITTTQGGSVTAITEDGDIISVCRKKGDTIRGKELLEQAVKAGGKKLDSYDGNFDFYVKCGFEPVSWCEFSEEYAPDDWNKDFGYEPIIFFKYVGIGNVKQTDEIDFYNTVHGCKDYDRAMNQRDIEVENEL